jgi:hypothetical protein
MSKFLAVLGSAFRSFRQFLAASYRLPDPARDVDEIGDRSW